MHDLLQASGYAALIYLLLNYFISFRSGRPLVEAINPNRKYLPFFAVGMFGVAYSLLLKAVWKYHETHLHLLSELVNEEKAKAEVVGAVSFVIFGTSVFLLAVWCWWNLPRDPKTFSTNPKDLTREYRIALKHYVHWKGGLDYAFLCEVRGGVHTLLAEAADDRDVYRGLQRLPGVGVTSPDPNWRSAVAMQKRIWFEEATRLIANWQQFNDLISPLRQGQIVTLVFDLKVGACCVEMIETPDAETAHCLYLFGASLNQHEVNTHNVGRHFTALADALKSIRRGVTKS
jgi:hypothetical protein